MANEAEAVEGAEEGVDAPAPGGKKKLIIIIAAALALVGGGFGVWKAFSGKSADGKGAKKEAKHEELLPPKYVNLDPPFVVNFEAEAAVRFLQVTIGVMTRDPAMETLIKDNDPRVRNDMLMILSGQNYASVSTTEGKEELRKRCLEAVRTIVKELHGEPAKIEALYFTSFVMQ
ncbi:MAG TPA: flagellar basal body-associated FliL family protein [Steroidobacteraceae bacterium]|nr:flagellar basal body-associated FliL family protein [Steroidobacteraceae bacterium]